MTAFPAAGSCFLHNRPVSSSHSDGEFRRVLGGGRGGGGEGRGGVSFEASPKWKIKTKIYDQK